MHWKLKARIQNAAAALPEGISYALYYWLQRRFGGWRRPDPTSRLVAGVETWRRLQQQGVEPAGKTFLEVGTGHMPVVPLAFWLMGAERTVTIDLNPYVKHELLVECLAFLAGNQERVAEIFGPWLRQDRLRKLLELDAARHWSTPDLFRQCGIHYIAPGDAARTGLPSASVDFHTSYTVFEHIPEGVLRAIMLEGNRIIKSDGVFVHRIDYTDHFSHSDSRISSANFLQFSDCEWDAYAGNRYMYANRLRHDDFLRLFEQAGHELLQVEPESSTQVSRLLETGALQVDDRFNSKPVEVLAVSNAWFTTRKRRLQ